MPGMTLRGDRLLRYVTGLLPALPRRGPGAAARRGAPALRLPGRGGRPGLARARLPEHGKVRTLYDESAEILAYLEEWTAPTKRHVPDVAGNFDPDPAGLPARAWARCRPSTPASCWRTSTAPATSAVRTASRPARPSSRGVVPVADVLANVDTRLSREEGRLDVLMLSGGEPTIHPRLARDPGRGARRGRSAAS